MQIDQPSWRKPAGMLLILLLILVWCVGVVSLVEAADLPAWADALLFVMAGIVWLWIFPMKRLLRWMETGR